MKIKQFDVWLADLNPRIGSEPGKVRPVLVIQSNLLNDAHSSTIICPITTNTRPEAKVLRVYLRRGMAGLPQDSDIIIDQLRAIDNRRLQIRLGSIPAGAKTAVSQNIRLVLDLGAV